MSKQFQNQISKSQKAVKLIKRKKQFNWKYKTICYKVLKKTNIVLELCPLKMKTAKTEINFAAAQLKQTFMYTSNTCINTFALNRYTCIQIK